ncbi:MAG: hypothetical protein PHE89_03865 [Alphaproteobacteria bacterium]|nr:hypothetical protein [Alphaproteobacteria bacterium]
MNEEEFEQPVETLIDKIKKLPIWLFIPLIILYFICKLFGVILSSSKNMEV